MHAIMRKFIFIAFLSVVSAANLILDYKCMPNVVCSSLMGGIRTGNSRGIQYINEFLITGIKPLHRAEGIAITCKPSFCGKPIKWGNVTISPSSSTPSCFEFPPVSTQESTPDGYKTCITQDEHSMFYNTIEKYYTNNNIRAGDAFYVTLTNIPEEGCPVPEKEKLVMQLDRYDTQIKFIPLVGTVDECCEYVKANGYYSVFVIYDGEKFKRKGCVKIYRTKTGIVVFLDQCSWVLTSDITVCRLLEDYYSEYLDYPSDGVPRVIRN